MKLRSLIDLFFLILLVPMAVGAQGKIQLNQDNIDFFQIVATAKQPITCYLKDYTLGTLSTRQVKIGSIWTERTSSSISEVIKNLKKKLKKAKRHDRTTQIINIKNKIQRNRILVRLLNESTPKCVNPLPEGQFVGRANSLAPYRETLTEDEIKHFLRKVAFGGNPQLEQIAREEGLTALVEKLVDGEDQEALLMSQAMTFGSQGFHYQDGAPDYPIYNPYVMRPAQIYRFIYSPNPFKEWMILNLSAHFSVNLNRVGFAYSSYSHMGMKEHWDLLIKHSMGSFKDLTLDMLDDKAMNFWLDNKDNQVGAPNQNFARELLELFILGTLDPVTGNKNYQEESIVAATGYLSGYYEDADYDSAHNEYRLKINFEDSLHDATPRSVFGEETPAQTFYPEGFVNYIFDQHPGAPRFIAERFAGMMLYPGLPENIVAELALVLKANNYQLKPFYKKILRSEAFFSSSAQESCFSSPLEHIIPLAKKLFPSQLVSTGERGERAFYTLNNIADTAAQAGQSIFEPPSVFSWKGSCNLNRNGTKAYGEGWIKTQRLLNRTTSCTEMLNHLDWYEIDLLSTLGISPESNAEEVVDIISEKISNRTLSFEEKQLIISYLRTFRGDDYDYQDDPNFAEEWIVKSKIPRVICLIYDLGFNNFR